MFVGKEGYLDLSFLWWQSRMNKSYFLLYCGRVRKQSPVCRYSQYLSLLACEGGGFHFLGHSWRSYLGTRCVFLPKTKEVKLISTRTCFQLFTDKRGFRLSLHRNIQTPQKPKIKMRYFLQGLFKLLKFARKLIMTWGRTELVLCFSTLCITACLPQSL